MEADLLTQVTAQTGLSGGMIFAAAVWVRGAVRELGLRIDAIERRIETLEQAKDPK